MKLVARVVLGPLLAAFVLVVTLQQTMDALHRAGHWSPGRRIMRARTDDPYERLDAAIARAASTTTSGVRDPFAYGTVAVTTVHHLFRPHEVKPPPLPPPVLTAIIWDNDPRALIHFNGRDYTVRSGGQFDEYRVVGITRDRVTLDKDGQPLLLNRPLKGE